MTAPAQPTIEPMRILVVDDDRSLRDALRRALILAHYDVATVENGQQALTRIASESPDATACPASTDSRSAGACAPPATAFRSSC